MYHAQARSRFKTHSKLHERTLFCTDYVTNMGDLWAVIEGYDLNSLPASSEYFAMSKLLNAGTKRVSARTQAQRTGSLQIVGPLRRIHMAFHLVEE